MEITPQEQQNRILTINALTRDYFIIVGIVVASNLVTLTLISFGTSNQLAISAMEYSPATHSLFFKLLSRTSKSLLHSF